MLSETQADDVSDIKKDNESKSVLSEKSLSSFLEMGKYADYTVLDYFKKEHKAIFDSSFTESLKERMEVTFPDITNSFPELLKYMYTSKITLTPENSMTLLQQSEYYQMTELSAKIRSEIEKNYLPKHVVTILKDAVDMRINDIIDKASAALAVHFDTVEWAEEDTYLNFLPLNVLIEILENRSLTLDTEYKVYQVVSSYTKSKCPAEITLEDCDELYNKIYFENLSVEQLEEVFANEDVSKDLLCRSLLVSLRMALGKPVDQEILGRQYTKHIGSKRGRDFTWTGEHFDTNGVIYWLGTQLNENSFSNPHLSGHVLCTSTPMQTGEVCNLVSRQNLPTWTASETSAFIQVDLGPSNFVLNPTHYSLRHGYSKDNVNLMYWNFEGSIDGKNWDVLKIHHGDKSLGGFYGANTWPLESKKWFRYFRVVTIGKYFVQICGIELYGNLLPRTLEAAFKFKEEDVENTE